MMGGRETWRFLASLAALVVMATLFWSPLTATVGQWQGEPKPRGFNAGIYSEPAGAEVVIQGRLRGTTPWIGNVECRNDQSVSIQARLQGFEVWARTLPCREGKSVEINARLKATSAVKP